MSCGVGCKSSSDLEWLWLWLWLWRRLAATAPIQPLAWECPYAMGAALKKIKDKKKKKEKNIKGENCKEGLSLVSTWIPG